jgi:hypothetical protein
MSRNETDLREPRAAEGPEMIAAMRQGVVEALVEHKNSDRSVIVWDRDTRQIVVVPPEEISTTDLTAPAE